LLGPWTVRVLPDANGGRGGRGDCERGAEDVEDGGANTAEIGTRSFMRDDEVGMVSRKAAALDEGVEGRVGGTMYSDVEIRLVEFICVLARDAAVGASYRESLFDDPDRDDPEPEACAWVASMRHDNDALRVSFRDVDGGVGGLRPEWDF
jgi:hypothetical protein